MVRVLIMYSRCSVKISWLIYIASLRTTSTKEEILIKSTNVSILTCLEYRSFHPAEKTIELLLQFLSDYEPNKQLSSYPLVFEWLSRIIKVFVDFKILALWVADSCEADLPSSRHSSSTRQYLCNRARMRHSRRCSISSSRRDYLFSAMAKWNQSSCRTASFSTKRRQHALRSPLLNLRSIELLSPLLAWYGSYSNPYFLKAAYRLDMARSLPLLSSLTRYS